MPRTTSTRSGDRGEKRASERKTFKSRKKSKKSRKKSRTASDSDNNSRSRERDRADRRRSVSSDDDNNDDEMNLNKELHPIGYFIRDRAEMVRQMFKTLRRSEVKKMLPEKLRKVSLDDLATLCVEELEVMSKKRIRHVLDGIPMSESSDSDESDSVEEEGDHQLHSQSALSAQRKSPPQQVAADSTTAIVDSPSAINAIVNDNKDGTGGDRMATSGSSDDDGMSDGQERLGDDDIILDENSANALCSHESSSPVAMPSASAVERESRTASPTGESVSPADAPTNGTNGTNATNGKEDVEAAFDPRNSSSLTDERELGDSSAERTAKAVDSDEMRIWSEWLEKKKATSPELRGIRDPEQWLATDRGPPDNVALTANEEDETASSSNDNRSGSERSTSDFWNSEDDEKASSRQLEPGILRSPTPCDEQVAEVSEVVEVLRVRSPPPPPAPRLGDEGFNPYRDAALSVFFDRIANEVTDDGGWRVVVDGPVQGCGGRPEHWHNDDDDDDDDDDQLEQVGEAKREEQLEEGECDERQAGVVQNIPLPNELDARGAAVDRNGTDSPSSEEDKSSDESMDESDSPVEADLRPGDDDFPGADLFPSTSAFSFAKRPKLVAPESDDEGIEGYSSGPEAAPGTSGDEILPPGIAPAANIPHIKPRYIVEDETGQQVRRKITIVSVPQLYKQIKRQREFEKNKQPDKVYTAEEEERMRQLKEQIVAQRKQRRISRIEKERQDAHKYEPSHLRKLKEKPVGPQTPPPGSEWDYPEDQDEEDRGVLVAEWPIVERDAESHATVAELQPSSDVRKKKKRHLTPESLERLDDKRRRHEEEIKKKMEVLAKLKAQRLELTRREKEAREKLKEMKAEKVKKKLSNESADREQPRKERAGSASGHSGDWLPAAKSEMSDKISASEESSIAKVSQRKRQSDAQEPRTDRPSSSKEDYFKGAKKARATPNPSREAEGKKKPISDSPTTSEATKTEAASSVAAKKPTTDLEILELEMRARAIRALMKRTESNDRDA